VSKVTTSVRSAVYFGLHTGPQSFCNYCPVNKTLFKVSPEIRYLAVCIAVATVAMETPQQVLINLLYFLLIENRSLSVPMVTKCCKLVKLCHINRRGPGLLRQSADIPRSLCAAQPSCSEGIMFSPCMSRRPSCCLSRADIGEPPATMAVSQHPVRVLKSISCASIDSPGGGRVHSRAKIE